MPKKKPSILPPVHSRILILRHQKVLLDSDLAQLYGVPVKRLNQQVKRNAERFPSDFMFQLTAKEHEVLRLHFATSSRTHGGRRYAPFAFTEHGAVMAATVLNSKKAIETSVVVVRAFLRLRKMLATNRQLAEKIAELEDRMESHDKTIQDIFEAIRELMAPPKASKERIGFQLPGKRD